MILGGLEYDVGTATFTNDSSTVAGTGTAWLTFLKSRDYIARKDYEEKVYVISEVVSDTEITLTERYEGITVSEVEYTAWVDTSPRLSLLEIKDTDETWPDGITANIIRPLDNYLTAAKFNAKANLVNSMYKIAESISAVTLIKSLWVFDENSTATTIKDKGTLVHDLTLSAAASTFQPDLQGLCPYLEFRYDEDLWYSSDHNDFTFSNGSSADTAFSIIVLCAPGVVVDTMFVGKCDLATVREWYFFMDSLSQIQLVLYDTSASAYIGQVSIPYDTDLYGWHTYIVTYSGNALPHGIRMYRDGVFLETTPFSSGAYSYMENGTAVVGNYRLDAGSEEEWIGNHKYGVVSLWGTELSSYNIKRIDWLLRSYVGETI